MDDVHLSTARHFRCELRRKIFSNNLERGRCATHHNWQCFVRILQSLAQRKLIFHDSEASYISFQRRFTPKMLFWPIFGLLVAIEQKVDIDWLRACFCWRILQAEIKIDIVIKVDILRTFHKKFCEGQHDRTSRWASLSITLLNLKSLVFLLSNFWHF